MPHRQHQLTADQAALDTIGFVVAMPSLAEHRSATAQRLIALGCRKIDLFHYRADRAHILTSIARLRVEGDADGVKQEQDELYGLRINYHAFS